MSCRGETYSYILLNGLFCNEETGGFETEPARELIGRETLHAAVVIERVRIVELAGIGNLFFGVGQLVLQPRESARGLQLRVVFRDRHQAAKRLRQTLIG